MKRIWAVIVSATGILIAGCGEKLYESRLEETLSRMKYEQKLDSYLQPPAQGKFKEMNVYLRPPKPMEESKLMLTEQPGMYDLTATFLGSPAGTAPPTVEGQTPSEAPVLPPMRLHVLGRMKAKKGTAKKGTPKPSVDPNTAGRGAFVSDVRALLAAELGPEANPDKSPSTDKKKKTPFKRLIYQGQSGNTIQVYFAEINKGETEVALVFDIPPALLKTPIVIPGIELSLDAFVLGRKASQMFNGGESSEGGTGAGEAAF